MLELFYGARLHISLFPSSPFFRIRAYGKKEQPVMVKYLRLFFLIHSSAISLTHFATPFHSTAIILLFYAQQAPNSIIYL